MESSGGIVMVDNLARVNHFDDSKLEITINEAPVKWCSVSLSEMINRGKTCLGINY